MYINGVRPMEPFQNIEEHKQLILQNWVSQHRGLTAGFTTRNDGYSKEPYNWLNIGLHVGDEAISVIDNRKRLTSQLGWEFNAWTCGEQVHGNQVAVITEQERGKGSTSMEDTIKGVDGLVTDKKDILLTSFYADCVPLYFFDPTKEVIGLAHAGWKGTVSAIALEMVETMKKVFHCEPNHILAAIGPSIGQCCYEVNDVVIQKIISLWNELKLPQNVYNEVVSMISDEKALINLKEINRQIMIKAGIMASHIEISNWCTSCNTDKFFSYRAENGKTGRMASWIGLSKEVYRT